MMKCRLYILLTCALLLSVLGCSKKEEKEDSREVPSPPDANRVVTVINPDSPIGLLTNNHFTQARDIVQEALWDRDLLDWADELDNQLESADVQQLCISLEVFSRACQNERIIQTLRRLGQCRIEYSPDWNIVKMFSGAPEVIKALYEKLPVAPHVYWDTAVPEHIEQTQGRQAARRWLEEQMKKPILPAEKKDPFRRVASGSLTSPWRHVYMDMLAYWGEMRQELARLEAAIRKQPADASFIGWYFYGRDKLPVSERPSVTWIPGIVKLDNAILYWQLGRSLYRGKEPSPEDAKVAAWLYEQALRFDLTEEQKEDLWKTAGCSMRIPANAAQGTFVRWVKSALPEVYVRANQLEKAQKLIEEITGKKDGTLKDVSTMQFQNAGMVQRATGQRVVEGRIREEEPEGKDSVGYWLKRAAYYAGRKEPEEQEKAYLTALALPENPNEHNVTIRGDRIFKRHEAVRAYRWFLEHHKRFGDLERFYRKEIQREGVDSGHYGQLVGIIGKPGVRCTWNDPMIWDAIEKRKQNEDLNGAYGLVSHLAHKAPGPDWFVREAKLLECLGDNPPPKLLWSLAETLYHRWYEYYRFSDSERKKHGPPIQTTRNQAIDMMLRAYKAFPDTPAFDKTTKRASLIQYLFLHNRAKEAIAFVEQIKSENNGRLPVLAQENWDSRGAGDWIRWAIVAGEEDLAMEWLKTAANFGLARGYEGMGGGYRGPNTERVKTFYQNLLKRSPNNSVLQEMIHSHPIAGVAGEVQ